MEVATSPPTYSVSEAEDTTDSGDFPRSLDDGDILRSKIVDLSSECAGNPNDGSASGEPRSAAME